jgi:hypothetical protein
MTTRRQLSTIALDHLYQADNALSTATALREQTLDQEHKDIAAILDRLTADDARDLLIRKPDVVLALAQRLRRYHDRAMARDARALAYEEKAKRLLIAAQHAH